MPERAQPSKKIPQPAQMEEYDSDHSEVKHGSAVQAKIVRTTSRAAPAVAGKGQKRESASDSGYSSVHSGQQVRPSNDPHKASSSSKNKPSLQRTDSRRSTSSKTPTGSHSKSKPCGDPKCRDATFSKVRSERRYTLPYAAQPLAPPLYPPAQLRPQYVQPPSTHVVPALVAGARPRTLSATQPRPTSFHGYANQALYSVQPGPPPSRSAYQNMTAPYYYNPRQPAYSPVSPTAVTYAPSYDQYASPTSPVFPSGAPAVQHNYSARHVEPVATAHNFSSRSQGLRRTSSARKPAPVQYSESESSITNSSESDFTDSEDDGRHRQRAHGKSTRPRRPSLHEARHTAPVVTQRTIRDPPRRSARYHDSEYLSSSENVDSDRTQRAVVAPRTDSSYSSRSRRPSVTTTSSGRTKATNAPSSWSDPLPRMYYLEDHRGRHKVYPSKEQEANIIRQWQEQKLRDTRDLQDRVEAYQREVRGGATNDLTAETLRHIQSKGSGSRVSHKSSGQSSSKSKSEGVKISHGGTVMHVYGDAKIVVREGDDGEAAFIINPSSSNGKDSAYQSSSKSSGSHKERHSRGLHKSRHTREEAVAV